MIEAGDNVLERFAAIFGRVVRRPGDSYRMMVKPGWARRTTILLAMQTEGSYMKMQRMVLPVRSSRLRPIRGPGSVSPSSGSPASSGLSAVI
jgi:hypothetical protein